MSYVSWIRSQVGKARLFMPAARAVIENDMGEILLVRRADDRRWGLPGGLPEVGESIVDCLLREVFEETALRLRSYQCFGQSTLAEVEVHTYPNGDQHHAYATLFCSKEFDGSPIVNDSESKMVGFVSRDEMPSRAEFQKCDWRTLELYALYKKTGLFICE